MIRPGWPMRPLISAIVVLFVLLSILGYTFRTSIEQRAHTFTSRPQHDTHESSSPLSASTDSKFHILLPASNGAVDMCKTILTSAMLDYPAPTLIAWNQTFDQGHLLGGGSHIAKISGVLEWLEAKDQSSDNDIVMMMDAYDIWFQLPAEVLLSRYHMINAKANKRLAARLGRAYDAEQIRQTIIFGAGKRCAPNQFHTVACYPIPDSPISDDVYGTNTDTVMGLNRYSSLKQRFLNSGYIIGPVKDMRKMFRRAWEKVGAHNDHDPLDNGSHGSDFMYHGSDQSYFNVIFGEQEFQREVMRRRHLSVLDKALGRGKPTPHHIEGTIIEDPLAPSFTHQPVEHKDGRPDEFGIGLDYFSDLGHQTINTDEDFKYLTYKKDIAKQLSDRKGIFACPSRVTGDLPQDILATQPPDEDQSSWADYPLFTNVCLNTIPVMIHHNGDKGARAWQWPMSWMQPRARKLLERVLNSEHSTADAGKPTGGAFLPSGEHLSWMELCPQRYEWELFRDVEKPEKPA